MAKSVGNENDVGVRLYLKQRHVKSSFVAKYVVKIENLAPISSQFLKFFVGKRLRILNYLKETHIN